MGLIFAKVFCVARWLLLSFVHLAHRCQSSQPLWRWPTREEHTDSLTVASAQGREGAASRAALHAEARTGGLAERKLAERQLPAAGQTLPQLEAAAAALPATIAVTAQSELPTAPAASIYRLREEHSHGSDVSTQAALGDHQVFPGCCVMPQHLPPPVVGPQPSSRDTGVLMEHLPCSTFLSSMAPSLAAGRLPRGAVELSRASVTSPPRPWLANLYGPQPMLEVRHAESDGRGSTEVSAGFAICMCTRTASFRFSICAHKVRCNGAVVTTAGRHACCTCQRAAEHVQLQLCMTLPRAPLNTRRHRATSCRCVGARQDEYPLPSDVVPPLHGMPLLELQLLPAADSVNGEQHR